MIRRSSFAALLRDLSPVCMDGHVMYFIVFKKNSDSGIYGCVLCPGLNMMGNLGRLHITDD